MNGQLTTYQLWAKTGREEESHLWEPVYVHLGDAAEIARLLWRDWLPVATKEFIAESAQLTLDHAELLVAWLAGVHDIGKATPGFQWKNQELAEHVRSTGLDVPCKVSGSRKHADMGQVILTDWLESNSWEYDTALTYTSIIGGHHGVTPSESELNSIKSENQFNPREWLGDEPWQAVQEELINYVNEACGFTRIERELQTHPLPPATQVLLTGLVIVADWISSNTELFKLTGNEEISWADCRARAEVAWEQLDLPKPLSLDSILNDDDELFRERFADLPSDAELRPAQRAAVEAARNMSEPGMIIIEAPMGNGKTEASLLCAEVLAEKFGDGGIAYLLPTMATSNAMFARVESWLEELRSATGASPQSIQLLHSKAALNEDFSRLKAWRTSSMGDSNSDEEGVIAHQWFSGRKRGLLASFVVGTVDQLLMAALNTKHVHLRHLGLAGKVVVIDEVHAYDAYMNVFLDRALRFLGDYGVPVVLLSATLPPNRREALIKAYGGVNPRSELEALAPRSEEDLPTYPLITSIEHSCAKHPLYTPCEQKEIDTEVLIDYLPDNDELLSTRLKQLLADGGCACVIRNTVHRAQATYELLKSSLDIEVKLVHSRFIAVYRAKNDARLLRLLGKDSTERPKGLVVVGTQVIEQSLDIDFDLMVTDIAPMDLLLQRMGRLHRHQRGNEQSERPALLRTARCIITGAEEWEDQYPKIDTGITRIYHRAVLWQTLQVLREHKHNGATALYLPHDIPSLVERTYEGLHVFEESTNNQTSEEFTEAIFEWKEAKDEKQRSAKNWVLPNLGRQSILNGWMRNHIDIGDENKGRAAVRDTQDSLEVVVIQDEDGIFSLLPDVASEQNVPCELGASGDRPDDKVARIAALCTVSIPPALEQPWIIDRVISALEQQTPPGWQESRWLKGQLALALNEEMETRIDCGTVEYNLMYSGEKGLEVIRREEEEVDDARG